MAHELKILKHKTHGNHNNHCTAIAKDLEKIRKKILNAVKKCVLTNIDEAIDVEEKIAQASKAFVNKIEDVVDEAAHCVVSNVLPFNAIECLDNVST